MIRLLVVLILMAAGSPAVAQEWQWSTAVNGGKTNEHARAWLWIPSSCKRVRAVVVAQDNMEELSILENSGFRSAMEKLGVAEVWVSPMFDKSFRFTEGAGEVFVRMMKGLADSSGYGELSEVPVVAVGHSAAASWPYYFAAWAPQRTLACISVSGQWPYFRDQRFAPDIWVKGQNIDFIPCLETMGEYEAAASWSAEGLRERAEHPAMALSMLACPAEGHFAASQQKIDYLALYIRKAMEYRLPRREGEAVRKVDPRHSGWLMRRWGKDEGLGGLLAAPVGRYNGDIREAFWFFDEEMVRATQQYEVRYRGLAAPLVGYVQEGKVAAQRNTHLQVELKWIPEEDGISFVLRGAFLDTVPGESPRPAMWTGLAAGSKVGHPEGVSGIGITRVAGPFERVNDSVFRLDMKKESLVVANAWSGGEEGGVGAGFVRPLALTFAALYRGDGRWKPAVQQAEMIVPAVNTEGMDQEIRFDAIGDQTGVRPVVLRAGSSAGLPVRFCVVEGPVRIEGDSLYWDRLPLRTRYPVRVTIAAWQYGRGVAPKVKSARVVVRSFHLCSGGGFTCVQGAGIDDGGK